MVQHQFLAEGVGAREVWAWAMYDFANSGYTTVVITALFNAYFVAVVAGNAPWATLAWTLALSISYALIMLTAPALGAYADAHGNKKRVLLVTTAGCILFTAGLSLAGEGDVALGMTAIILSNFFFGSGENIIAAFLPELGREDALGKLSGWGWGLGFLGGLLSLGVSLMYITWAQGLGQTATQFVPVAMLITAGIFLLASLPTFLFLKERAQPQPHLAKNGLRDTLTRLRDTLGHAARYRDLWRFLICILFYQAGIQTVITLAAIYAEQAMHFSTQETLQLVLVVNVTAALGAVAFGFVQDRIGHVPAIAITLLGWMLMVLIAWGSEGQGGFWIAANLAGLCLGSSQSAGRALVAYLSPVAKRAEFFGLWGLAVKCSSILGPLTYGLVSWLSHGDHRLAMLITGSYFVVGLVILLGIRVPRGRVAALAG